MKIKEDNVVIVHLESKHHKPPNYHEFIELAHALGVRIVHAFVFKQFNIHASSFLNPGKLEQIKDYLDNNPKISSVLINDSLSPSQQKKLENGIQCNTLDRHEVILQIFAKRAQSYEGKLQVELAQLTHLSTRLTRFWTHLERQKGGIGLRGPGETQLEIDKRLIKIKIKKIKEKIKKIKKTRTLHKNKRAKHKIPFVSLVGYTSTGKTTLFNQLTKKSQYSDAMLFATLDPNIKEIKRHTRNKILVSDTVGFISDLPSELILAFHSTLEEIENADVIMHVIDGSHAEKDTHIQHVEKTLNGLNVSHIPILHVTNKIDICADVVQKNTLNMHYVSAKNNLGIDQLVRTIEKIIYGEYKQISIEVNDALQDVINTVSQHSDILDIHYHNTKQAKITLKIHQNNLNYLMNKFSDLKIIC